MCACEHVWGAGLVGIVRQHMAIKRQFVVKIYLRVCGVCESERDAWVGHKPWHSDRGL